MKSAGLPDVTLPSVKPVAVLPAALMESVKSSSVSEAVPQPLLCVVPYESVRLWPWSLPVGDGLNLPLSTPTSELPVSMSRLRFLLAPTLKSPNQKAGVELDVEDAERGFLGRGGGGAERGEQQAGY